MLSTRKPPSGVEIPPTAVGGSFKSFSKRGFEISTHCRGWDYQTVQGYVCRRDLNQSTHFRGWDLGFVQSHAPGLCTKVLIPPTAVGGSFKCFLPESYPAALKSHQRQLVDRSSPFLREDLKYPPTAVGGINGLIPLTAVGGSFKCFLLKNHPAALKSHQRQLVDRSSPFLREDLKYPPTAVGGITKRFRGMSVERDLNQSTHCRGWDLGLFVQAVPRVLHGVTVCANAGSGTFRSSARKR